MTKIIYLVAVDGSEWSDRAAERAVTLAQKTGAEVHFINAISNIGSRVNEKKFEQSEKDLTLTPLLKRFADSGVKTEAIIEWGDPAEIIHRQAKKEHANMIFLGRRGRSKLGDILLGSVADTIAHHAGIPIVLVP
jgi:nucleotide-binding universal stress UspA family protein